jgi:hypothetical protein
MVNSVMSSVPTFCMCVIKIVYGEVEILIAKRRRCQHEERICNLDTGLAKCVSRSCGYHHATHPYSRTDMHDHHCPCLLPSLVSFQLLSSPIEQRVPAAAVAVGVVGDVPIHPLARRCRHRHSSHTRNSSQSRKKRTIKASKAHKGKAPNTLHTR